MDAHELLRTSFGFPAFRPGQAEALAHVLAGRDTLVVMPTGSGKSLIYQLAALLLPGTTLVISPLVALMKDQVDSLTRRSIAATFINSTLAPSEQAARLRNLSAGQYKLVLVAPERLRNRAFQDALASVSLGLLVVDEAHCLSQWGHDFRPDYLHIASARQTFGAPHTLALTATATPRVQADIVRLLEMPDVPGAMGCPLVPCCSIRRRTTRCKSSSSRTTPRTPTNCSQCTLTSSAMPPTQTWKRSSAPPACAPLRRVSPWSN